ncbi:MAG: sigma-70 family polymerase sigma factor [Acidobacteria bacterium]|jgi:RNA polymerase sigma factor (TIGR02999 family)|nr:sigma-70 family polymerase sigma factor [Acidobacteriota bacterium]
MGSSEITQLLHAYGAGDRQAFDRMVPMVYEELRSIARRHLRRTNRGQTLDTTGLVHEVYLKFAQQEGLNLKDRGHFFAVSARAMRQIIIDRARARASGKRGRAQQPLELDEDIAAVEVHAEWLLDIDRVLNRLRAYNQRLAQTFECRFFAGLSEEETAEALGVSLRTVQREWQRARIWIRLELTRSPE